MERDKALQVFTDPAYKAICVNIAGDDADDLYQELFLYLAELPTDKLEQIVTTCPLCWFATAAKNQYRSSGSRFHKLYRQDEIQQRDHHADVIAAIYSEPDPRTDNLPLIMSAIDSLHWYDYHVLTYYAEAGSLRALSRRTKIPVKSLHDTITIARKTIKKYIHDHSNNRG